MGTNTSLARFLRNLAIFLQDLAKEWIIFANSCKIFANKKLLAKFFKVSRKKCILWNILARNMLPGRILQEMHWPARTLQELHNLARFLQEVSFWTNLAEISPEKHFCSTRVLKGWKRFLFLKKIFKYFLVFSTLKIFYFLPRGAHF